jgi:hypothetical protein
MLGLNVLDFQIFPFRRYLSLFYPHPAVHSLLASGLVLLAHAIVFKLQMVLTHSLGTLASDLDLPIRSLIWPNCYLGKSLLKADLGQE